MRAYQPTVFFSPNKLAPAKFISPEIDELTVSFRYGNRKSLSSIIMRVGICTERSSPRRAGPGTYARRRRRGASERAALVREAWRPGLASLTPRGFGVTVTGRASCAPPVPESHRYARCAHSSAHVPTPVYTPARHHPLAPHPPAHPSPATLISPEPRREPPFAAAAVVPASSMASLTGSALSFARPVKV